MRRIGVFVCWCGSNIAATVDVKAVAEGETYTWDLTQLIPPGQEIVSWELEP